MDYSWCENYPDLNKLCRLFQMEELLNPKRFKYKPLGSLLQDGPQCGIIALTLYTENVSTGTVTKILNEAKKRGYTYNGEIFSCYDLCQLAKEFTHRKADVYEGPVNSEYIKDFLFNDGCLLVPYDCDKSHGPCLQNGKSAHWAAISGIVETELETFVLAKQGKSKNIGVWKLKDLSDSNGQLKEFSPARKYSNLEYKLPVDGVAFGLCNKSVLLHNE